MKYIILLCAVFLISCTGTYDENQAKMDEIYGCKKPGENLSTKKYQAQKYPLFSFQNHKHHVYPLV